VAGRLILAVVCVAQLMVVLDVSIVNVALPSIGAGLGFSPTALQWVIKAYNIAFGGFLLFAGRAADLYGPKRTFLAGVGAFSAASLAGGLAQSSEVLVVARTAQGLGAAVLSAAALTILIRMFTERSERARALAA
jgi:MFS family permease